MYMFVNEFIVFNGKYACKLRIKNVICDILRLRRVAIATFSAPPQCDPCGAFLLTRTISTKFHGKQSVPPA